LSIYVNKKTDFTVGEIIFAINVVIFSFAAYFLGIEVALYSILTYLAASKTVDFFIEGIEEYIGITIISDESEKIRKMLIKEFGKGVTIYKGKKGFNKTKNETDILFTFVTRLEVNKIKQEIINIDYDSVIIEHGIKEVRGGIVKKRPLQKSLNEDLED
jgi:uncharacterized membrane-anchored protein YitT (DUF2179 family)